MQKMILGTAPFITQSSSHEEAVLVLLEHNAENFPQTAANISIALDEKWSAEFRGIGELLDASMKLRAAGLRPTEENLRAIANNPNRSYFGVSSDADGSKAYFNRRASIDEFKLECQ